MSPLEQALYDFLMANRYEVPDPEYPDFCRCAQGQEAAPSAPPWTRSRPACWMPSCWSAN